MKMRLFCASLMLLLISSACYADSITAKEPADHAKGANPSTGLTSLSAELRELLNQEMRAIEAGMKSLVSAIARGDKPQVVQIARQIEASYLLKQNLTPLQMGQLHSAMPAEFLHLDQEFHYFAGMLGYVANENKTELVGFYLGKMVEACASCHAKFAQEKFPGFKRDQQAKAHHH